MNVHVGATVPFPDRQEIEALAHALHGDPFHVLGPHETSAGVAGACFPAGRRLRSKCCGARTARGSAACEASDSGLFQGVVSERAPYLLRITWPGGVQETEDPYSFGPCSASSTCTCSTKGGTSSSPKRSAPM